MLLLDSQPMLNFKLLLVVSPRPVICACHFVGLRVHAPRLTRSALRSDSREPARSSSESEAQAAAQTRAKKLPGGGHHSEFHTSDTGFVYEFDATTTAAAGTTTNHSGSLEAGDGAPYLPPYWAIDASTSTSWFASQGTSHGGAPSSSLRPAAATPSVCVQDYRVGSGAIKPSAMGLMRLVSGPMFRAEYCPLDLHDFANNLGAQSPEPESELLTPAAGSGRHGDFLDITCGLGQTDASSGFTGDVALQATTRGKSPPTPRLRLPFRQVGSPHV